MPHQHFNMLTARPATEAASGRRSLAWLRVTFLTVVLVAVAGTLALLPFLRATQAVYAYADEGKAELLAAERAAEQLNIPAALAHVDAAEQRFASAQAELFTLKPFEALPAVGAHIAAADDVLTSGVIAVSAIRDVLFAVDDIIDVLREGERLSGDVSGVLPDAATLFKDVSVEQKRALLAALERNAGRFADADQKIDAALAAFDDVDARALTSDFRASLDDVRGRLVEVKKVFAAFRPIAEYLPSLLGYPEERRYLLFFQNNTELRPTGGFLGLYGTVRVKDAELVAVHTDDVYALDGPAESTDRPDPPAPVRKYIGIDEWYLRDANWSPDFPSAAEVMERFYREEAAVAAPGEAALPVDGIIAFTPSLAEDLLRLTGPISVDGTSYDAENLVDRLEFQVEREFALSGIPASERKDVVGKLLDEMIARFTSLPLDRLLAAVAAVHTNLDESQILLQMKDERLQRLILENDWGGKLRSVQGDYVMVVDANLASLKSDPAVMRTVSYAVTPTADGYEGAVTVSYDHRGSFDWKTTRYRTYTRVFVPDGARLIEVEGAMENDRLKDPSRRAGVPDSGNEAGRAWFGAFISIEPKEQRTLKFRYTLPNSVVDSIRGGSYRLVVEKQPGTEAHGLTVDLDFGKNVRSATPPEAAEEFGDARYRYVTDLRVDREFDVEIAH